ncbi:hypothetical protein ABT237_27295 [Streptomyces sp. NPDC001581]|uniref:hypothetical protein n=1 Tax=Streptomyces sp. NPDC001581 TaxID=3154386 RepID=UPI0033165CB1
MPATQSLVLTGTALADASAATDCDTAGCAAPPAGQPASCGSARPTATRGRRT